MIRSLLCVLCCCVVLLSCDNEKPDSMGADVVDEFFDLHGYVSELIKRYDSEGIRVNKKVSLNDNSELLEDHEVDWKAEFQPLLEAHINRSAWLDKFKVDTIRSGDGFVVTYRTDRVSIPVREMEVGFDVNNAVKTIRVETRRKNLLYNSKQVIELVPDVSYRVDGSQRALFLSRTKFKVDSYLLMETDTSDENKVE